MQNMFPVQYKKLNHCSHMQEVSYVTTHKGRQTRILNWILESESKNWDQMNLLRGIQTSLDVKGLKRMGALMDETVP